MSAGGAGISGTSDRTPSTGSWRRNTRRLPSSSRKRNLEPSRYLCVWVLKAELAAQDDRPHVPHGSHKVSTNPDTPSRPRFKELELTGHLEELSGALAVSPRREFKGFPQGGALQLHQVEGSPEGQDGEQVLHRDGACGRNSATLSAADATFYPSAVW